LTPALTPIAPYKSQTRRWKRGIISHGMNDPQPEGHMAIETTKILTHAGRPGSHVAAQNGMACARNIVLLDDLLRDGREHQGQMHLWQCL
jgi:hypothetical protein